MLHFTAQSGNHAKQLFKRTHFANRLHLSQKVIESKLVFAHFLLQSHRFIFVERFLRLFNQAEHVAHSQNSRRHPVRVEHFQVLGFFAATDKFYRPARDSPYRQCRAAASVPVHLGQDDPVDSHHAVEVFRDIDRILSGHRVNHQHDFVRFDQRLDIVKFIHQFVVDMQSAGCIDDHDIPELRQRRFTNRPDYRQRIRFSFDRQHRNVQLLAKRLQLLYGCRSIQVGRHQQRPFALFGKVPGQFGSRRRLAGTLQSDHHDHGGRFGCHGDAALGAAHHFGHLFIHDFDDLLSRIQALQDIGSYRAGFDPGSEILDDFEVYVSFQ